MPYMVTFAINIPQMLAYIPYMDPMGYTKQIFLKIPYLLQDCRNRCSSKILGHLGSLPTLFSSDNSRIETKRITSCNEVISICIFGNLDKLGDVLFNIFFDAKIRRKMLKDVETTRQGTRDWWLMMLALNIWVDIKQYDYGHLECLIFARRLWNMSHVILPWP